MATRNQLSSVQRSLINPPTYIEYKGARFLIVDAPSNNNLPLYIKVRLTNYDVGQQIRKYWSHQPYVVWQEFDRWNVTDVVRCCEPTYAKEPLEAKGIKVHDWVYGDGEAPPNHIVDAWLGLIEKRFGGEIGNHEPNEKTSEGQTKKPPCIATHCVAGLGRWVWDIAWRWMNNIYIFFLFFTNFVYINNRLTRSFHIYSSRAPVLVAIALIEEGMSPLDSVVYIRERRRGAINNKQLKYIESYKRRSKGKCIICWLHWMERTVELKLVQHRSVPLGLFCFSWRTESEIKIVNVCFFFLQSLFPLSF